MDLHSNIQQRAAIYGAAIGANATKTGPVIDRQGFEGVEFIASYGDVTTTGTVVTLVIKEGDTTGALTSVADADLIGTELLASLPAATPRTAGSTKQVCKRVGYKGAKRYVQALMVQTGTTSTGHVSAAAILHTPLVGPVANP